MVLGIVSFPRFKIELADIRQAVGLVQNVNGLKDMIVIDGGST